MDREVQERHRRRWLDNGLTEKDDALNQQIENFNDVVDNMLAPTVHRIEHTEPLNYDMNVKYMENVIISDVTRYEAIKDEKLLHTKLNSIIDSGSYIWWNNEKWIVLNEENNTVQSHKSFVIRKCSIDINILLEETKYTYPVYIYNLTLYSDGAKELVNLTTSSAKYSIMIAENKKTNTLDVGTRFIIRGRAFEISLIDDFTIKNVRTLTICETVTNTFDDIENDIAYNSNSESDLVNPNLDIIGNDVIYLGDTLEYTLQTASSWDFELGNKALTFVSSKAGKCKVKCSSDSKFIGEVVKLIAYDYGGNIIDKKEIRIGGMF